MKYFVATWAAAVLALAAGGMAQAGGKPVQHHQPHDIDRGRYERPDRHDYRDHCEPCHDYSCCGYPCYEHPCYEYPCYENPCYEYPCYDYPPCGPDCDYKAY